MKNITLPKSPILQLDIDYILKNELCIKITTSKSLEEIINTGILSTLLDNINLVHEFDLYEQEPILSIFSISTGEIDIFTFVKNINGFWQLKDEPLKTPKKKKNDE